jgi:dipeptidyl aminopeptidase/acylaminoacyl peptidase
LGARAASTRSLSPRRRTAAIGAHRPRGPDAEPQVSPDGRLIAYTGFDDRKFGYHNSILYVMNRDGSNRRALTESFDRSVESPVWAADGRSIFVGYEDKGEMKVARVGLDGSVRTVAEGMSGGALDRPYTGGSFSVARDGTVAMTAARATRPADIALVRGGAKRQLTAPQCELLDGKALGQVRKLTVPSSADQRPIDAWLTLPAQYREGDRYPLILEITAARMPDTARISPPTISSMRPRVCRAFGQSARLHRLRRRVRQSHPPQIPGQPGP